METKRLIKYLVDFRTNIFSLLHGTARSDGSQRYILFVFYVHHAAIIIIIIIVSPFHVPTDTFLLIMIYGHKKNFLAKRFQEGKSCPAVGLLIIGWDILLYIINSHYPTPVPPTYYFYTLFMCYVYRTRVRLFVCMYCFLLVNRPILPQLFEKLEYNRIRSLNV